MDNKNTRAEKLKIIFANHPDKQEVFMTSDDRAFFAENQAHGYAQTLKEREVKKYDRTDHFQDYKKEPIQTSVAETGETITGDGTGENVTEDAGDGDDADSSERAAIAAEFEKVIGKKPNHFMKVETMTAKIAEALAAK